MLSRRGMTRLTAAAVAQVLLSTCSVFTDSRPGPVRVALHLGALAGAQQGDFTSVMDRAELAITDAVGTTQLSQPLDPGEFDPFFDVEVEEGQVTFATVVRNAAGTVLYQGETVTTVDADGFLVEIVPQPINPVMVAMPRRPAFVLADNGQEKRWTYPMRLRNAGTDSLTWRVDSQVALPQGFRLTCRLPTFDGVSCLVNRRWAARQDEPIEVILFGPSTASSVPPNVDIRFVSDNSGTFTVPTP